MPVFTIENVVDYLIYGKEEDNMRAEDIFVVYIYIYIFCGLFFYLWFIYF